MLLITNCLYGKGRVESPPVLASVAKLEVAKAIAQSHRLLYLWGELCTDELFKGHCLVARNAWL